MIEDEAGLRAAANQLGGGGQLSVVDADVERQAILGQQLHATQEIGPQAEIGLRLTLEQAAHAFDQRASCNQRVEEAARSLAMLHRRMRDDRLDTRIFL